MGNRKETPPHDPDGDAPDPTRPEGAGVRDPRAPDGDVADGDVQDDDVPDGVLPDGDVQDGDVQDGDLPDGVLPDGDVQDGDVQDGDVQVPGAGDADACWLAESYPLVDADFVGATLDRVLHDRSEIASEAACVDGSRFEPALLDRYAVPTPSPRFVDDTLVRVLQERSAGLGYGSDAEYEFHRLIENAQVPAPRADFVAATLRRVLADRRAARPRPLPALRRPVSFSLVAAAAAIVLSSILLLWPDDEPQQVAGAPVAIAAPVRWAALVTATDAGDDFAPPMPTTEHPLLVFARRASGGER